MEHRGLFGRVLVVGAVEALNHPNVDHVVYILQRAVACADLFIQHLREIEYFLTEVRFPDRAIHARLILLVEGYLRCRCRIILYPQAHTLVGNVEFDIQRLQEPNVLLVAVGKYMCVIVENRERIFEGSLKKLFVILVRLCIVNCAAVVALAADTFVVVEGDVVWGILQN